MSANWCSLPRALSAFQSRSTQARLIVPVARRRQGPGRTGALLEDEWLVMHLGKIQAIHQVSGLTSLESGRITDTCSGYSAFSNLGHLHNLYHTCLYEMAKTASNYRKTSCLHWLICIFSTNLVAQFLIFYLYHRKKKVTILTSIEIRGWAVMRLDLSFSFCLARARSTGPSCNCQGVGKTDRCESATQARSW